MSSVAEKIRAYIPDQKGSWLPLDMLFSECFAAIPKADDIDAIFAVFERFPEEDGAGVFWSAIHGLEAVGGYEGRLKQSLRSAPSLSAVALAIRAANSGDASFLPFIAELASRDGVPSAARSTATRFTGKKIHG